MGELRSIQQSIMCPLGVAGRHCGSKLRRCYLKYVLLDLFNEKNTDKWACEQSLHSAV
jgi:hypothetical protein